MTGYDDRSRRMKRLLYISFIVTALIFGFLMLQKYRARHDMPPTPPSPPQAATQVITLFFASPEGTLVREAREIGTCADLPACISAIIGELAKGPLGDLTPTIPDNTTVRSVFMEGDTAVVDLGGEFVTGLPGGSSSEMTAVYSIVNSISHNFPRVKKVRFLIDGRSVVTLKDHFDLRKPVEPNPELEKK